MNDEISYIFIRETNMFYEQSVQGKGGIDNFPKSSRARDWKNVTPEEMKAFIGIVLYMGLVRLPNIPLCVHPCFERYHSLLDYKVTCSPELHK